MKKFALLLGCVAAVLSLASCSKSVDRADVVKKMKEAGVSDEVANCMTDGMLAKFPADRLTSNDKPTAEEQSAMTQIATDCMAKNPGAVTTAAP